MTKLFHCTHSDNADSIRREGLIPRDTTKHNYPSMLPRGHADSWIWANAGVEAVYCHTTPWRWMSQQYHEAVCVEIDAEGLRVEPDPVLNKDGSENGAWRILEHVSPDRITIHVGALVGAKA